MFLPAALFALDAPALPVSAAANDAGDPLLALLPAVREGDRAATRRLLDAVAPTVRQVVGGAMGHAHPDLDDVSQECLVAIVRALASFRGECRVRHYAARIAVRIAREARTRRRRSDSRHAGLDDLDGLSDDRSLSEDSARARRGALWRKLLASLPEAQAEAMIMRVVLDWTLEEMSEATGAPVNTLRSRVRLAREALREQIERNPRYADLMEGPR